MYFSIFAFTNILYKAYSNSDFFGKFIFFSLFFLSIVSWIVLLHKMGQIKRFKFFAKGIEKKYKTQKDSILNISFEGKLFHPFIEIYTSLKQKTFEILKKNRYFAEKNQSKVYLSRSDIDLLESQLGSTISNLSKFLDKNIFILSTIVTLAPFLGLLGTVWGILITFSNLNSSISSANSEILSGLSMALGTTVIGLIVAIPALVSVNYLKHSIGNFNKDMEVFSHNILTTLEIQYKRVE